MAEDDDLSLGSSDLSDIFGGDEEEEKSEEDLGKSIEDLFTSDGGDDDDLTLAIEACLAGLDEAAESATREADEASRRAEEAIAAALAGAAEGGYVEPSSECRLCQQRAGHGDQ